MRVLFGIIMTFLCMMHIGVSFAQTLNIVRNLSFGEAVVTDNSAVHTLTISPGGSITSDPEFIIAQNPESAVLRYTGGTPAQAITSVVVTLNTNPNFGGQNFTLNNFTTTFPPVLDGSGEAIISVGASLNTSGNSVNYFPSSTFAGFLDVTINF